MEFKIINYSKEEMDKARVNLMTGLRESPNNFSYWFPHISMLEADAIRIPKSFVIPVPENLLDAFSLERKGDLKAIERWVAENVMPVISENFPNGELFIKNGCFSNKFCFNTSCHITNACIDNVTDNLCNIQYDSLTFDTGGNLEIILREWIPAPANTPTIYDGMPLRPEMRLFYDFDKHIYIYHVNYWDWDYCHDDICRNPEDKDVYEKAYPALEQNYSQWSKLCEPAILKALRQVKGLKGKWSVDFILEPDRRPWLIDMAVAERSAYWNLIAANTPNNNL